MEGIQIVGIIALLLFIWLLCQRWAWVLLLFVSAIAAAFACIASIVHFQILGALGFAALAWVLWFGCSMIAAEG